MDTGIRAAYVLPRARRLCLTMLIILSIVNMAITLARLLCPVPQFDGTQALLSMVTVQSGQYSRRWLSGKQDENQEGDPPASLDPGGEVECRDLVDSPSPSQARAFPGFPVTPDPFLAERASTVWQTTTTHYVTATSTQVAGAGASALPAVPPNNGDVFTALWMGPLGVCLQRRYVICEYDSGTIPTSFTAVGALSSAALLPCMDCASTKKSKLIGHPRAPDYLPVLTQSGLSERILSSLPHSTRGASAGLLIAVSKGLEVAFLLTGKIR